jgi:hypothetical protein
MFYYLIMMKKLFVTEYLEGVITMVEDLEKN